MKKYFLLIAILININTSIANQAAMRPQNKILGESSWGTHIFPLVAATINTKGPILEMGCGDWSTPLLHVICKSGERYLLTVETNKTWLNLFNYLKTAWHEFVYLPVFEDDVQLNPKPMLWDQVGNERFWSVVFIDHHPAQRRVVDVERLRKNTEIFVIHDTQAISDHTYNYQKTLSTFKYRYDYDTYTPHTTVVSDTIDVTKFFN